MMTRYDEWRLRAPEEDTWLEMEMQQEEEARAAANQDLDQIEEL